MHDAHWPAGAYLAEFADGDALTTAVHILQHHGYTRIETYSPVPLPGITVYGRSRLPIVVSIVGLIGGVISYAIQWYANAYSYPLNLGGRPANATPAFIVSTFEGTILAAALAVFVGFFWIVRLPKLWHPVFEIDGFERVTIDRYWLSLDATDPRSTSDGTDGTMQELRKLSPLQVLLLGPYP